IDRRVKNIIKSSQSALATSYQKSILGKEKVMQQLLDTLIHHRQISGIYDPEGQTELLATRATEVSNAVERERATLASLRGMKLSQKIRDSLDIIVARISGYERELDILNNPESTSRYSLRNFNLAKGNIELLEARYKRAYEQI